MARLAISSAVENSLHKAGDQNSNMDVRMPAIQGIDDTEIKNKQVGSVATLMASIKAQVQEKVQAITTADKCNATLVEKSTALAVELTMTMNLVVVL